MQSGPSRGWQACLFDSKCRVGAECNMPSQYCMKAELLLFCAQRMGLSIASQHNAFRRCCMLPRLKIVVTISRIKQDASLISAVSNDCASAIRSRWRLTGQSTFCRAVQRNLNFTSMSKGFAIGPQPLSLYILGKGALKFSATPGRCLPCCNYSMQHTDSGTQSETQIDFIPMHLTL